MSGRSPSLAPPAPAKQNLIGRHSRRAPRAKGVVQRQLVVPRAVSNKPYVVLVGMDFSEPALHALRKALAYAVEREHVELHVACILAPDESRPPPLSDASRRMAQSVVIEGVFVSLRARIDAELADLAPWLRPQERLPKGVTPHVAVDAPGPGLVELAREVSADVILIGAHGQGPALDTLGSVAKITLSRAPCTVILTRALPPLP